MVEINIEREEEGKATISTPEIWSKLDETNRPLTLMEKLSSTKLLITLGMFMTAMVYLAFYNQEACVKIAEEAARAGLYMVLVYIGYRMPSKE